MAELCGKTDEYHHYRHKPTQTTRHFSCRQRPTIHDRIHTITCKDENCDGVIEVVDFQ